MALKDWLKDLPEDTASTVPEGFAPLVEFLAKKRLEKSTSLDKKQKAAALIRLDRIKSYQKMKKLA